MICSLGEGALRRWTLKAQLLARVLGVDPAQVELWHQNETIKEAHVWAFAADTASAGDATALFSSGQETHPAAGVERVMVLGSAMGGGAALIIYSLSRIPHQVAVGILDRDQATHGQYILGVPVLGSTANAHSLWKAGQYDAAVIAFNSDLDARAALFEELSRLRVPFANVIDPAADVRLGASIGTGNVILAFCHVGPFASMGNDNFLSCYTCIEHHCQVGDHCAVEPAVAFSGRVRVGDRVRFGTRFGVEPDITIGSDAVIASGVVITQAVPPRTTVKIRVTYTISPRA